MLEKISTNSLFTWRLLRFSLQNFTYFRRHRLGKNCINVHVSTTKHYICTHHDDFNRVDPMKKKFRKLKMVDPVTLLEVIPMEDFFLPLERPLEFSKNGRSSGRFRGSFPWKSRSCKTLPSNQ